jgi:hypothetical protein
MRTIAPGIAVMLLTALGSAQTGSGSIQGVLSDARGPLRGMEVRVKNENNKTEHYVAH